MLLSPPQEHQGLFVPSSVVTPITNEPISSPALHSSSTACFPFHSIPFLSIAAPRFYGIASTVSGPRDRLSVVCGLFCLSFLLSTAVGPPRDQIPCLSLTNPNFLHFQVMVWAKWVPSLHPSRSNPYYLFASFSHRLNAKLQPKIQQRTFWLLFPSSYSLLHVHLISLSRRYITLTFSSNRFQAWEVLEFRIMPWLKLRHVWPLRSCT